jgi:O-antigen ligase
MLCFVSIFWGGIIEWIARVVMPFLLLFIARTFLQNIQQIKIVIIALIYGYVIPIIFSSYSVFIAKNVDRVEYLTGISRSSGIYQGPHAFAYAMLIFSFIYCIYQQFKIEKKLYFKITINMILLLSILCLYSTYTRTAFVGFVIFWLILGYSKTNKLNFIILALGALIIIFSSQQLEKVFWKTGQHDLNTASSGRLDLWVYNWNVYLDSNLFHKLVGYGIGNIEGVVDTQTIVGSSHNDYLELLMAVGIIGLILYLLLLSSLTFDVIFSSIKLRLKYLFIAIIASTSIMNFLSNACVFRIEVAQLFWFFMGIFYCLDDINSKSKNVT